MNTAPIDNQAKDATRRRGATQGSDSGVTFPKGVCIVCGSVMLIQYWRGHIGNQRIHCNDCGSEATPLMHAKKQPIEQPRTAAVRSSDLLAVTKLKCRNGDTLDALEDQMVELYQYLASYGGKLKEAEAKTRLLREIVQSVEARIANVECRMGIWRAEHGEKLKALTANAEVRHGGPDAPN